MKLFQGDNKLIYPFTVKREGSIVDLTNATVELSFKNKDGSFKRAATITDASTGLCQATLFSTDLSTHGIYYLQGKVTYQDDYVINGDMFIERVNESLSYEELPTNPEPPPTESGSVQFEDWTGEETVEIDTGTTEPPPDEEPPTDTTAPTVTANPNGGTFQTSQSVTLSANETATIYYTLDGSTPTETSSVYSTAINLTDTATLKFFAKDTAGNTSAVQSVTFTKDAQVPADTTPPTVTITPNGGTFTTSQQVALSANETATIYYTTDGSTPTEASTVYSAPFTVSATTTVQYFAKDTAGNSSAVQSAAFTKQASAGTVLVSDSFNRVDSAVLGTTDTGQNWQPLTGVWGIVSNQAYLTTNASNSIAVVDSGVSNCTIKVKYPTINANSKVIFRCKDSQNYIVFSGGTISKVSSAIWTTLGSFSVAPVYSIGDEITITLNGNAITVQINNGESLAVNESFNSSFTKHGVGANSTASRFDDFKVLSI